MLEAIINLIKEVVGSGNVIENQEDKYAYETPWRGNKPGKAALVVLPTTTQQVSDIVKICNQNKIPIVAQGGNTGLVSGSIPDQTGNAVLLSLSRMKKIEAIDIINQTSIVESGRVLSTYKEKLLENDMYFPLKMASEGSAQMGGIVSTNAGGTAVLRYGTMRELVLGVEAVLADGSIINELHGLRKNNTGYNISQLLVGAEGTLGIITRICVKIYPQLKQKETAFIACDSLDEVMSLFQQARNIAGETLTAFELVPKIGYELVTEHIENIKDPLKTTKEWAVLIELSTTSAVINLRELMEQLLIESQIKEGVIAESEKQRQEIWALREYITEAEKQEHDIVAFDISIPIAEFPAFIISATNACQKIYADTKVVAFGHVGDGNVHFNLLLPQQTENQQYMQPLKDQVYDAVQNYKGSFSAEHGVGRDKQDVFKAHTSAERLAAMQTIKQCLDPHNIMNPGVILDI